MQGMRVDRNWLTRSIPKHARDTAWMLMGFSVRLGIQIVYFVLITRSLQPEQYGTFVAVVALVSVLAPFASWGSGNVLIKHVATDPLMFRSLWGGVLAITLLSGSMLVMIACLLCFFLFGVHAAVFLAIPIAVGDLLGIRLADVAGQAFQGKEQLNRTSLIWALMSSSRLAAALGFFLLIGQGSAYTWATLYGVSGLFAGIVASVWVSLEHGCGQLRLAPMKSEWRQGFYFALSLASQGAYNDLDKTLLAKLDSHEAAGAYGAAYRILDACFTPVRALLYASYPRFFRYGAKSVQEARRFALQLLPWALGLAAGAVCCVGLVAPLLISLIGVEYGRSLIILYWLLPIMFARSFHYLAADALTGSGYQSIRSLIQVGIAIWNLILNLAFIPLWGWKGAVWASWVSDGTLALVLWAVVAVLASRHSCPVRSPER